MKGGGVVNLAQAEEAIRLAVDAAEQMASVEIESVVLSISAGRLASELFAADVDVAGSTVSEGDIARVLAAGSRHSLRDGRAVLHSLPVGYSIDGTDGIRDPRGMLGSRFGVDMHVATTDIAAARNLTLQSSAAISPSRPWWRAPMWPASPCWPTTRPISARPWSTSAPVPPRWPSSSAAGWCMWKASRSAASTSPWISRAD